MFDLVAEPADVHIDDAFVAEVVLPYLLQQLLAGQHPAGVLGQLAQQPELGAGERDRVAGQPDLAGLSDDLQVAEQQGRYRLGQGGARAGAGPAAARTVLSRRWVHVRVDQDLDLASVGEIRAVLDTAMSLRPARLVVNLAGCPFIDAAGISRLLAAQLRARQCDGRLLLRSARPPVRRVLHLARVDDVLTVETPARTEEDAPA